MIKRVVISRLGKWIDCLSRVSRKKNVWLVFEEQEYCLVCIRITKVYLACVSGKKKKVCESQIFTSVIFSVKGSQRLTVPGL